MKRNLLLAAMLVLPMGASATLIINRAETEAYNPAHDVQQQLFNSVPSWDAAGRMSHVEATSESHPFDPPINIARSWSTFNQLNTPGAEANYHAFNAVIGEYNAIQSMAYRAEATLEANYEFEFTTAGRAVVSVIVPVHGLFAAKSPQSGTATASASVDIIVPGTSNYHGGLNVSGRTDGDPPVFTTTGEWAGRVVPQSYTDPFNPLGQGNGLELASLSLFTLGTTLGGTFTKTMQYRATSSATISYANGSYAYADLSNTAGFQFEARDDSGALVALNVRLVPEPSSFAVLGLGLFAILRRKK